MRVRYTEKEVLENPMKHIRGYCRYKSFTLKGNETDSRFEAHSEVYGKIHLAVRWGISRYAKLPANSTNIFDTKRFVLDLWNGEIVWQNFDKTNPHTYKFKGIGNNYKTY
jgi:hypothetical protein